MIRTDLHCLPLNKREIQGKFQDVISLIVKFMSMKGQLGSYVTYGGKDSQALGFRASIGTTIRDLNGMEEGDPQASHGRCSAAWPPHSSLSLHPGGALKVPGGLKVSMC